MLLLSRFPNVTKVEAGKILREAFPFTKRQTCHHTNGKSEYYYYRVRLLSNNTAEAAVQACLTVSDKVAQLEKALVEKDKEMAEKEQELKRVSSNYSRSVEKIRILEKQKETLVAALVTELKNGKVNRKQPTSEEKEVHTDDLVHKGNNPIPEIHLTSIKDETAVIGPESCCTCELVIWKNIKVCVKKLKIHVTV